MTHKDPAAHAAARNPASAGRRFARLLILVGVLVVLASSMTACGVNTGISEGFSLGRTYRLEDGDLRDGNQVIFAYNAEFQPESVIAGDLTLTGNDITLDATVRGNVVIVADRLRLGETALIAGDLVACVNELDRHPHAQITGELRQECLSDDSVSLASVIEAVWAGWRDSVFFRFGTVLIGALLFGAFAALGTVFVRRPMVRMSEALRELPWLATGVGAITMLAAIGLTLLYAFMLKLVVPLVLLPLVLLLWLALLVLSLLGWLALAEPFGIFLLRLARVDRQPHMITAAIGGIALALLLRLWSVFWVHGWIILLAVLIFGAIGLGPVLLTRFGTRTYAQLSPLRDRSGD